MKVKKKHLPFLPFQDKIKKQKISITFAPIIAAVSCLVGYYGGVDQGVRGPVHVKMCFTPGEPCLPLIVRALRKAKRTIDVQAYTMTSNTIAQELIDAKKRGVKVRILFDKTQKFNPHGKLSMLKQHNLTIRIDYRPAIAHNKVMIIDHRYTLTGSYNWTEGAERRNAENLLLIKNKSIAKRYLVNFEKRWLLSLEDKRKKNLFPVFKKKIRR